MLVFAQNIVLSAAEEALPDGTPLILWDSVVTNTNVNADSEDTNYPATNMANDATNQEWRGAAESPTPTQVAIDVEVNSVEMIDGVGIARHNLGREGIAVSIYAVSVDSPSDPVLLAGPQIFANDEPVLFVLSEQSFATLRIVLDVPAGVVPRIAVLKVAKLLRCERGFDVGSEFTPPRFARKTQSMNGKSYAGDYLGRIITSQAVEGAIAAFKHFNPDWYREEFDPFVAAAQRDKSFFFAWAPDDYPYEVFYGGLADDPYPLVSPITGRMSVSLKMDGIIE